MAKRNILKIEQVYFAFTNIDKPLKDKFDTSGLTKKFNATIVLSKEQRKTFKEHRLNKTVKEIDTSAFEEKYKFAPPYPEQDEQYLIQVSKKATYKDGNLKPEFTFPKAFFEREGQIIESSSTLIGNGSFGDVRLELMFNETLNQTNVTLDSVLVRNHIPYESKGDEWSSAAVRVEPRSPLVTDTPTRVENNSNPASHTPPANLDDDLPF